jgi:hypothetical protein
MEAGWTRLHIRRPCRTVAHTCPVITNVQRRVLLLCAHANFSCSFEDGDATLCVQFENCGLEVKEGKDASLESVHQQKQEMDAPERHPLLQVDRNQEKECLFCSGAG